MSLIVTVRVLHVLLAVLWVGAGIFATLFLFPALRETSASGNPLLAALMRRRMGPYMGATAGLAALTGVWLYWHYTNGFSASMIGTSSGMLIGIGGITGIAATAIGGAVIGRSVEKMAQLIAQGAPQSEIDAMRQRAQGAARLVSILMIVTVLAMTIGRFS